MRPWRFYRQRSTAMAVRIAYPVCVGGAAACIFGAIRYGNPAPLLAAALALLFLAIIVWGEVRGVRQGIYESGTGLKCVTMYGASAIEWDDVIGFDHRRTGTWDRVFAQLRDGHARPLPSVLQGQRIVWSGGETRDIVGVLNDRLAQWHACHGGPTSEVPPTH